MYHVGENANKIVLTEEQLIKGIKRGNSKCQSLFYNQHASALYGIARRYTQSEDDAKDVLQEAFIKIFDNIEQYSGCGVIRAWMTRIVVNQALRMHQQKKAHLFQTIDDDDNPMELMDKTIAVSDVLTHEILLQFIHELPEGYQMVFNLCEIEGYSHDEVAEMLNYNASTSRSQLFRAKSLLRKKIDNFHEMEKKIYKSDETNMDDILTKKNKNHHANSIRS